MHKGQTVAEKVVGTLKRRHQLLTFIGALMVFFTFVVKEGLRDQVKDVADSIGTADQSYVVRTDINTIRDVLTETNDYLFAMAKGEVRKSKGGSETLRVGILFDEAGVYRTALDNMARLLEKLPQNLQSQYSNEFNDLRKDEAAYYDLIQSTVGELPMWEHDRTGDLRHARLDLDDLTTRSIDLHLRINSLAAGLRTSADKFRTYVEQRYRLYSWVSYVLFGVGWGLALLGKLIGVDIPGAS